MVLQHRHERSSVSVTLQIAADGHLADFHFIAGNGDGNGAGELLSLINPIKLTEQRAGSRQYRLEPYVMAADIYSTGQNLGRGGWSWYTGAAGWTYRAAVEHVLGVRQVANTLVVTPCIPSDWAQFEFSFRHANALYRLVVSNPGQVSQGLVAATFNGVPMAIVDGTRVEIALGAVDGDHEIKLTMGAKALAVAAQ